MKSTDFCCILASSPTRQQLITYSLGQSIPELDQHLADCAYCRGQVDYYRGLLALTREVLATSGPSVGFVACRTLSLADGHCIAEDQERGLALVLARREDALHGQILGCSNSCVCWEGATVRLFGSQGFVVSSRVDEQGTFQLPGIASDRRYSLGLVLAQDDPPQLRIIGELDT
jgi:hypothetical protein